MLALVLPFPTAPNFAGLTDEEVRRMEGSERQAVEQRVQCLRNIQTLLDAATVQLHQYLSIMTALTAAPQFAATFVPAETASSATENVLDPNAAASSSAPSTEYVPVVFSGKKK